MKIPKLSTKLSSNGKNARKRFERIFKENKRKSFYPVLLIAGLTIVSGMMIACENAPKIITDKDNSSSIKALGGTELVEKLYSSKTKYIGSVSATGKVLKYMGVFEGLKACGIELETTAEPYGIIRDFEYDGVDDETGKAYVRKYKQANGEFEKQAAIFMSLVDNSGFVQYRINGETVGKWYRKDIERNLSGIDLSECSKDYESFKKFYEKLYVPINSIDEAVAYAILEHNGDMYYDGECRGEGHIILKIEPENEVDHVLENVTDTVVYALTTYGNYQFQNECFVKVGGTGIIPVKITLDKDYHLVAYEEPDDGSHYTESLKVLFPKELHNRIFNVNEEKDLKACEEQEQAYARKYLEDIKRAALIGNYRDFEYILPNVESGISNILIDLYWDYPYWAGTLERIDDGKRLVYETIWEEESDKNGILTYKKYEYDTKNEVEKTVFEIKGKNINCLSNNMRKSREDA